MILMENASYLLAKNIIDLWKLTPYQETHLEPEKSLSGNQNLILINLDDVFCENPNKKCLIGNEKYSFYIDESHLSTQGANLTRGKFSDKNYYDKNSKFLITEQYNRLLLTQLKLPSHSLNHSLQYIHI